MRGQVFGRKLPVPTIPSTGLVTIRRMASLRHNAVKGGVARLDAETRGAAERAHRLKLLSRDQPELSAKLGEAHTLLDAAGKLTAEGAEEAAGALADLTLTAATDHALRIRAVHDPAARHELARRGSLALAA